MITLAPPPIVSTIAEMNGVLAQSMWTTHRDRDPETLTSYEAMLRSFGYYENFTPEDYRLAVAGLKRAIEVYRRGSSAWTRTGTLRFSGRRHAATA